MSICWPTALLGVPNKDCPNPSDDFYGGNSFLVPAQDPAHYHEPDPYGLVTLTALSASTTAHHQDLYQLQCSSKLV
jgi:hypothetical protein